jgi:hypothetical protein
MILSGGGDDENNKTVEMAEMVSEAVTPKSGFGYVT